MKKGITNLLGFVCGILLLSGEVAMAQPKWISHPPEGYLNDYFVGKATSSNSNAEASERAFADAIVSINQSNSITVKSSEQFHTSSEEHFSNSGVSTDIVTKAAKELSVTGESQTIRGLKMVETYFEKNGSTYEAWVLVSFPKKNPISPPSPHSPVWRSLLVPGWGQLYNDETFKGISFVTLGVAGVATGFICSALSRDSYSEALNSRNQARRDYFNDLSNTQSTISTISFISAGVVYAWSLVDAIVVKPENFYVNVNQECNEMRVNVSIAF
jgi:hypothetical protein